MKDYVYGLGGRDCGPALIRQVFDELLEIGKTGQVKERFTYLGVRE